jgi:hypothetical protein
MQMSEEHAVAEQVDDFATGYKGAEVLVSTSTPSEDDGPEDLVGEGKPAAEAAPAVLETPAEEPKFRQITEEDYAALMNLGKTVNDLREEQTRKFDQAFGKIGGTEQLLRNIQSATPRGKIPQLTKEDMGALAENYEYMSDDLLAVLNKTLSKLEGTGTAGAVVDPQQVASMVQEGVSKALPELAAEIERNTERKLEFKAVKKAHPDAEEIFAAPEFKQWFVDTKQQDSWDADKVIPVLKAYKEFKSPPAPTPKPTPGAPVNRTAALKDAVNPVGAGGVPKAKTEDDDFVAGYNSRDT